MIAIRGRGKGGNDGLNVMKVETKKVLRVSLFRDNY